MLLKLILALTLVPLIELFLLVKITVWAGSIGFTIGLVLLTGILGAVLARHEGLRVVARIQEQMNRGEMPADSILDGALVLVAAALLLTPGLLTDLTGFFLLLPAGRALVRRGVRSWIQRKIETGQAQFYTESGFQPIHDEPPPGFPPMEDEER